MRVLIEIAAAVLLIVCVTASSAAFAAGKGRSADGLSCAVSLPQNATPAAPPSSANAAASSTRVRVGIG